MGCVWLCHLDLLALAAGAALQCADNVGFLLQDFYSLLDTLRLLALGTKQQIQPLPLKSDQSACSYPWQGWRALGRGQVGVQSWDCQGSCGSGLAARCYGSSKSMLTPAAWLKYAAWGDFVSGCLLTASVGGCTETQGPSCACRPGSLLRALCYGQGC